MKVNKPDSASISAEKPQHQIHLLFIHHSTGGQLLADKGSDVGKNCIYVTHPNGGGLRRLLEQNNYIVHEASYGSIIGNETDICHWNIKFRDHMDKILICKNQDEFLTDGTRNKVVVFKSCFTNSWIDREGTAPGNPDSCDHTTANYRASYNAILRMFAEQKDTIFVVMTAPPIALTTIGKIKNYMKHVLGKSDSLDNMGQRIRSFNNWLKDTKSGWLANYPHHNVVVFDYYDVLTGYGKSNWSCYGSDAGRDSHPSSVGNTLAAQAFVPFLNRVVKQFGMHELGTR